MWNRTPPLDGAGVSPIDESRSTGDARPTWLLFGELLSDCFPDREIAGGAPFNVAAHLAALRDEQDGQPLLVSRVGHDARGEFLLRRLRELGLGTEAIQFDGCHASGHAEIRSEAGGHRFVIDPEQAWDYIAPAPVLRVLDGRQPAWIYFGTLAQRGVSRATLRSLFGTNVTPGFLDVNLREEAISHDVLEWSLGRAQVLKLNEDELRRIAALTGTGTGDPRAVALRLIERFGIGRVIVTRGEHGAWTVDGNANLVATDAEATPEDFRDSVGAGDAFAAVCLLGLVRGWPVELWLRRANRFARGICRIRGAVPDRPEFYEGFRREFCEPVEHIA